jgi:hypothetical protein
MRIDLLFNRWARFGGCSALAGVLALASGCAKDPAATAADAGPAAADAGPGPWATAPLAGTVSLPTAGTRDVAPFAFGQNYWNWEPSWGDPISGTESLATAAGVKLIRSGGANNEIQTPNVFSNAELDRFVAYCKTTGAQPVLQVPVIKDAAGQPATPQDAADMVTYANVTRGYGIKYWSIGNEPDLYTSQALQPATYAATDYCATFKQFVTAMKGADPTIQILGPELSWKYIPGNDWLTPFLDGCKDSVDIVSVHRYPIAPNATTVAAAFGDAPAFRQAVRALRANLDQHGMTAIPLAVTEEHITYNGDPLVSTLPASPQTFYAGMWVADVLGVALEEGLWTSAFWHIADATTGWKLAFILGKTPLPSYYAYQLIATSFAGRVLAPAGVPAGFSVYASRDAAAGKTAVLILNKTAAAARIALGFDAQPAREVGLDGQSMALAVFADGSAKPQVWRYTKDLADAVAPPTQDP